MKTTLNLDDELLLRAKEEARRRRTTLTTVVTEGLQLVLREPPAEPDRFMLHFPTVAGGAPRVDPADREALHDLMNGLGTHAG